MPNTSYLVRTSRKTLYPAACDPGFDPRTSTVAAGVRCVPVLWLAMFRPHDLVTQEISTKEGSVTARSVVTATDTGMEQLRQVAPSIEAMFGDNGSSTPYSELLIQAVSAIQMPFLTIELDEIAALFPKGSFQQLLELTLNGLQDPGSSVSFKVPDAELTNPFTQETFVLPGPEAKDLRDLLTILGGFDSELGDQGEDGEPSDEVRRSRLLGGSHFAPVPW